MKMPRVWQGLSKAAVVFAAALVCARSAFAQGCALCYNDAAATGPQAQAALRHGILALAIPPMLIFATIFAVLYRRRNLHHDAIHPAFTRDSARPISEIVLHLN